MIESFDEKNSQCYKLTQNVPIYFFIDLFYFAAFCIFGSYPESLNVYKTVKLDVKTYFLYI